MLQRHRLQRRNPLAFRGDTHRRAKFVLDRPKQNTGFPDINQEARITVQFLSPEAQLALRALHGPTRASTHRPATVSGCTTVSTFFERVTSTMRTKLVSSPIVPTHGLPDVSSCPLSATASTDNKILLHRKRVPRSPLSTKYLSPPMFSTDLACFSSQNVNFANIKNVSFNLTVR